MPEPTILYCITLPDLGGAQSHVLELLRGFRGRYRLQLATSAAGPLTRAAADLGIPVSLLPSLGRAIDPLGDLRAVAACADLIGRLRPALVHFHSSKAGLVGRVAAWRAGVPAVFTAHGWGFKPGVPPARRALVWASEAGVARLAARIICVSEYDRQLAWRYVPHSRQRLVAIHNGLDDHPARATPQRQPVRIIMTARFHEPKEQQLLLRAFARLGSRDAELLLVGDGPELAASQALARELQIDTRVRFLGDRPDVPELLAQAQIFTLLSRYEGLPVSILEAMRAGLPVIASDVGGVAEELAHGSSGLLVPRGDVAAVAAALGTLVADPALRARMGAAGRQRFLDRFTRDRMLARTDAVYQSVLAERGLLAGASAPASVGGIADHTLT